MAFRAQALALLAAAANAQPSQNVDEGAINLQIAIPDELFNADCQRPLASDSEPPTADCAPKNAFGSPSRASSGEIGSYRPEGSAHALPDDSASGGLLDCQADAGNSADGGEESSASVTLTGSRSGSSEVPRFD